MKLQSDIGHFPSVCGTCLNKNRFVPPNCPDDKCARPRTRTRNCNVIAKPGSEVSTWIYCSSRYILMKRSRSYCNVVLLRDSLTVKPCYRPALAIILPHPFLVRFISCFTFLCLTGCSLADAARLLFIIGYHDGHLLAV